MLEENQMYVIETDGSIHEMLFCGDSDWEERATTSIQELKNKVIDDFAHKIKKDIGRYIHGDYDLFDDFIDDIAQQLKAGGIDGNERTDT